MRIVEVFIDAECKYYTYINNETITRVLRPNTTGEGFYTILTNDGQTYYYPGGIQALTMVEDLSDKVHVEYRKAYDPDDYRDKLY